MRELFVDVFLDVSLAAIFELCRQVSTHEFARGDTIGVTFVSNIFCACCSHMAGVGQEKTLNFFVGSSLAFLRASDRPKTVWIRPGHAVPDIFASPFSRYRY